MAGLRDHEPFIIEDFNGLWDRGDDESCPSDHFLVANNVQYFDSGVETRPPLDIYQSAIGSIAVKRMYNYVTQTGQSLLVLNNSGNLFHIVGSTIYNILNIAGMNDFGFVAIAGRAYITPFQYLTDANGQNYELGMPGEFLYVYKGDGTPARKAGGAKPSNGGLKPFMAYNDFNDGTITKGIHLIVITFDSGGYTPTAVQIVWAPGNQKIQLNNIPIGVVGTTTRTVCMTHAIDPTNLILGGSYPYFNVTTIPDNVTTELKIDLPDASLTVQNGLGAPIHQPYMEVIHDTITAGFCDFGLHIVGVVFETDTGYLSAPGPEYFASNTFIDAKKAMQIFNIPLGDATVVKRHIVSTKAIIDFNGDLKGYQFFFVPKATIENNTDTYMTGVSFYDSDLISDASHLMDNMSSIPAGVSLNTYHGRLVLVGDPTYPEKLDGTPDTTKPDNRSVARVSAPGEPEAISKVDGLIIAPLDGSPLTNCQEFRDVLYLFKKTRTYAYVDNSDEPATWQEEIIDQGIGAPVHGIASVLDSGGVNTDFLIIVDWSGLMLFNGTYARPEMSFKIEDYWAALVRNEFRQVQIVNDSIGKRLYMTLPPPMQNFILYADYANGMDSKSIRWSKWVFDGYITSLCLIDTNKLVLGVIL